MTAQPQHHVEVDLAKRALWPALGEVIRPPLQVPVELFDQPRQRFPALAWAGHLPQMRLLAQERLFGGGLVQVTLLSSEAIPIQPEAVAEEVQAGTRFPQVHHPRLLPVDFQPQPSFEFNLDEGLEVRAHLARQDDKIVGIAYQHRSRSLRQLLGALKDLVKPAMELTGSACHPSCLPSQ